MEIHGFTFSLTGIAVTVFFTVSEPDSNGAGGDDHSDSDADTGADTDTDFDLEKGRDEDRVLYDPVQAEHRPVS